MINFVMTRQSESDVIPVNLNEGLMESVMEYLCEGSTIGVKASLKIDNNILRIIGEKLTFINSKQE